MTFDNSILLVTEKIEKKEYEAARKILKDIPAADAAAAIEDIEDLDTETVWKVVSSLDTETQAELFGHFRPWLQAGVARLMGRDELALLFEHMEPDERADLYNRLSESERQALLPGLAHAEREDIRLLSSYPEDTVGSVMTSAYLTLRPESNVVEALETIRLEAPNLETIYQSYVLDSERHLIGTLSLKDLLLADPSLTVEQIMIRDVILCRANEPRVRATQQVAHYDILAVPVVNDQGQMVGIVTHDDALDVSQDESAEDQLKLGAVGTTVLPFKDATIAMLYKTRVGWLVLLVFGNIFSGAGIAHFEDLIEQMVALVFFLPLLIDSGGNAGSQSATLMVRALATEEVERGDWLRMLLREITVSIFLGLSTAAAVFTIGYLRVGYQVAFVVALTMITIVVVGSVIGMLLPLLLNKLNFDPATASAPLITTICDGTGVLIYFNMANALLAMPAAV